MRQATFLLAGRFCWFVAAGSLLCLASESASGQPQQPSVNQPALQPAGQSENQPELQQDTSEPKTAPAEGAEGTLADEPAQDQADPEVQRAATELIVKEAYPLHQSAKTEEDYTKMLDLCQRGIEQGAPAKVVTYAQSLMSWAHNRRGQIRLDADRFQEAMADFDQSISLDPQRWLAFHNRGYCHAKQQQFDQALEDLTKALEIKPDYFKALTNRGEIYYALGQYEEAVADYTAALQLRRQDAKLYNQRGHAYWLLNRRNDALRDYNQAISLDSDFVDAYINRGDLLAEVGRLRQAALDYRRALQLDSSSHRGFISAAWMMSTSPDERYHDADRAIRAAQRALDLLGDVPNLKHRYLDVLAASQAAAGQYDQAVQTSQQAIDLAPESLQPEYQSRQQLYRQQQPYRQRFVRTSTSS